jgi:hypothetical protein
MADLLDIAPSTASAVVRIQGQRLVVRGLNASATALLASRFPELRKVFSGGSNDIVGLLIELCGSSIGPIIAAGCGHLGDEKYEQQASGLLLEEQVELLTAILGLMFPNGVGSFVEKVTTLMGGGAGERAKTVKMRLRKSPLTSQPSSAEDSRQTLQ